MQGPLGDAALIFIAVVDIGSRGCDGKAAVAGAQGDLGGTALGSGGRL
jgi:hypothetical protein